MWYTFNLTAIVTYDIYNGISVSYSKYVTLYNANTDKYLGESATGTVGWSNASSTITNVRFKNSSGSYINYNDGIFTAALKRSNEYL